MAFHCLFNASLAYPLFQIQHCIQGINFKEIPMCAWGRTGTPIIFPSNWTSQTDCAPLVRRFQVLLFVHLSDAFGIVGDKPLRILKRYIFPILDGCAYALKIYSFQNLAIALWRRRSRRREKMGKTNTNWSAVNIFQDSAKKIDCTEHFRLRKYEVTKGGG